MDLVKADDVWREVGAAVVMHEEREGNMKAPAVQVQSIGPWSLSVALRAGKAYMRLAGGNG